MIAAVLPGAAVAARLALVAIAALATLATVAVSPAGAAESGFAFLRLPVDARSVGMGEAGVSFLRGAAAFHSNPAGLADPAGAAASGAPWGARGEAALTHHEAFGSLRQDAVVFALAKRNETLGLSFNTLYSEAIEERDPVGVLTGDFGLVSYVAQAAYARQLPGGWRVGVSGGYFRERLADAVADAWTIGGGAMWQVPAVPGLALGAALRNLGGSAEFLVDGIKGESVSLPATAQAGASYTGRLGADLAWLVAAEARKARDEDATGHAGIEVRWSAVSLRAGSRLGTDVGHFTAGLGLEAGIFGFDYAYLPSGAEIGDSHRAQLSVRFGM